MSSPIVRIKQGQIKGKTDTDLDGETFYKFLGIPYAKPPTGPLRFKAPQAPESWKGIRDCTKEGNPCLAATRFSGEELVGSEDCLYLNVFTKQLPQPGLDRKPVMVFIHGGGFIIGSSSEELFGAQYLITEDIVLVTINYRIGILGFLSSDDLTLGVPGNAGLKDQTFALKWIQENIVEFNGDPNNVTIFGVSAGGASVSFQTFSPTAKGLFHKVIAQSGSALNPWAWGCKNAIEVAEKIGKRVSSDKEALQILMNMSAEELIKVSLKIPDEVVNASKRRPFGPVIEKPNPTAFLTENPINLLASGKYIHVPTIQGIVSNEGLIYEFSYLGTPFKVESGCEVPWNLHCEQNQNVAKLVNEFYFKQGINKDSIYKFIGDVNFVHGVIESTKLISETSSQHIYLYVFSHETNLSNILLRALFSIDDTVKGVAHGGDQMLLFHSNLSKVLDVEMTEESQYAVKQFIKLWADFARSGRPHQHWEPVTDPEVLKYFDIDNKIMIKTNPFSERVAFWENIFKETRRLELTSYSKAKL